MNEQREPNDWRAVIAELATAPDPERVRALTELVTAQTRAALGERVPERFEPARPFLELGFDSLAAVELHRRLVAATGLELPVTLVFDYPTPQRLVRLLCGELFGSGAESGTDADGGSHIDEPIAIVGMACRYPGGVGSPEQLWQLVADGVDATSEFPTDRGWDLAALYDPDPATPGTSYTRRGGFLYDAAEFDASFFGVSPREALAMDPQQRLLLRCTWELFERAGIQPETVTGSGTGVFVGAETREYGPRTRDTEEKLAAYRMTGTASSVISGRLAYFFGFEGPTMTVDTACSSSLVALHLAAQSLRLGECRLAVVGGATVLPGPDDFVAFSRQRGLAPDGRCKPFADAADGTAWGEGVGVLLVERLLDARRNGHRVLAVIRGSAVNSDGTSNGLTAPNGPAQRRVIMRALAVAGLAPAEVDAVEAHGTGTTLGDPIEAHALIGAYGQGRIDPLWIGSIKSNIGHTQSAAGLAGVIKTVQAMRHGVLPRTLHAETPSTQVDWSAGKLALLTEARPWHTPGGRPRRAGVSSFGMSGTNAHVILEEAVEDAVEAADDAPFHGWPVLLSGADPAALRRQADKLREHLDSVTESAVPALAAAAATRRTALDARAALFAADRDELRAALTRLVDGAESAAVIGPADSRPGQVGVLFTGGGSQRLGAGRELYQRFDVFAAAFDKACDYLNLQLDRPLETVLFAAPGSAEAELLQVFSYHQCALFAVQVALFRLLEHLGFRADYVAGHSSGELAAAHVAGVLSLEDAAMLAAARVRLSDELPVGGVMVAVQATESEVVPLLTEQVSVAAVNGVESIVLSGAEDEVLAIVDGLRARGRRTKRLAINHASHSPLVAGLLAEYEQIAELATYHPPRIPFVSTVTGGLVAAEIATPEYWIRHIRNPVRFLDAVRSLRELGVGTFVELGPDSVLSQLVLDCLDDSAAADAVAVPVLRSGSGDADNLARALATLHVRGVPFDWETVFAGIAADDDALPTYAFDRTTYWLEDTGPQAGAATTLGLDPADHPLLGAAVVLPEAEGLVLTGRLSVRTHPWLADHAVDGAVLVPGTAFVELARHAGDQVGAGQVEELTLELPLLLDAGARQVRFVVGAADERQRRSLRVYSRPDDGREWVRHATGSLVPADDAEPAGLLEWPPRDADALDVTGLYDDLAAQGYHYGSSFRGLAAAWRAGTDVYAEVVLPDTADATGFGLHPALLDAALHGIGSAASADSKQVELPFNWSGVRLYAVGARRLRVRIRPVSGDGVTIRIADHTGAPVADIERLTLRAADPAAMNGAAARLGDSLFHVRWAPVHLPEAVVHADRCARVGTIGFGPEFADLAELGAAIDAGMPVPQHLFLPISSTPDGELAGNVHGAVRDCLDTAQNLLADTRFEDTVAVFVSTGAVAVDSAAELTDLAAASAWGLLSSLQAEEPGRLLLIDVDERPDADALAAAPTAGEPRLAIRSGALRAPRLARAGTARSLTLVDDALPWRLRSSENGSLDELAIVSAPEQLRPLEPHEIRIAVRACGLNFQDVLRALGMRLSRDVVDTTMGNEGAGIVTEIGSAVTDLRVGDRVMGVFDPRIFGPVAVTDSRLVAPIPPGWSFHRAAAIPLVYLTAYYGLVDLGALAAGETVLVHAAAGGVGMAAVQLARALGAQVLATASPGKWSVLHRLGLRDEEIASSRDLEFAGKFGRVHVVLNSLAGEFTDASLGLLRVGGRFVEMGKTDLRDAAKIAERYPGITYAAFDLLLDAGPERIRQMWRELRELFDSGRLQPEPPTVWDVRHAPELFRTMSQGKHVGKQVLTIPARWDPDGTVLITGGTGALGGLVARHIVAAQGIRHLVLTSRRGPGAEGVERLVAELAELGARATVVACDAADRDALRDVLESIPDSHPLTAVVHAAGQLDDGLVRSMTAERLYTGMRSKVDAAVHLHELTEHLDLAGFVMFSSAAGVFGEAGQGNYAAANTFLDALATYRRARGLPGLSVASGFWEQRSGMTGHLGEADIARMARSGMAPLSNADGLGLFDLAQAEPVPMVVAAHLNIGGMRAVETAALLRGLVRAPARRTVDAAVTGGPSLAERLAAAPVRDRDRMLLDIVRRHVIAVLDYDPSTQIDARQPFRDLGFDSLSAVELRNRIAAATSVRLPGTAVFDYPTPAELAAELRVRLLPDEAEPEPVEDAALRRALATIPVDRLRAAGLLDGLLDLIKREGDGEPERFTAAEQSIDEMDTDELIARALHDADSSGQWRVA